MVCTGGLGNPWFYAVNGKHLLNHQSKPADGSGFLSAISGVAFIHLAGLAGPNSELMPFFGFV